MKPSKTCIMNNGSNYQMFFQTSGRFNGNERSSGQTVIKLSLINPKATEKASKQAGMKNGFLHSLLVILI